MADASLLQPAPTARLTGIAIASFVLATAGFGLVGGLAGLLAGAGVIATWYLTSAPVAVAFGHVLLAALLPTDPALATLVPVEVGLFGLLAAAGPERPTLRDAAVLTGTTTLLGGLAFAGHEAFGLTAAVGVLAVCTVLGSYTLHRYELLRLGLLDVEHAVTPAADTENTVDPSDHA